MRGVIAPSIRSGSMLNVRASASPAPYRAGLCDANHVAMYVFDETMTSSPGPICIARNAEMQRIEAVREANAMLHAVRRSERLFERHQLRRKQIPAAVSHSLNSRIDLSPELDIHGAWRSRNGM